MTQAIIDLRMSGCLGTRLAPICDSVARFPRYSFTWSLVKRMSKKARRKSQNVLRLLAYTDESGNTGHDLFNDAQPYFWAGTLLSPVDIQTVGASAHQDWKRTLGVEELHGKDLRLEGIAKIALSLRDFLQVHSCNFVFSKVEKAYHAGTTLAWILLDSDFNQAVSRLHEQSPLFRRMLTLDILHLLTFKDAKDFWTAYQARDVPSFGVILENLQLRLFESDVNERGKELLLDALAWAARHPEEILRKTRDEFDSPNILALGLLLSGINELIPKQSKVVKFVHDEQNQFDRSIRIEYERAKNVTRVGGHHPFSPIRLMKVQNFSCPVEFTSSHTSIGLQIIDPVMWLVKRSEERPEDPLPADCICLLDFVQTNARRADFTHELLIEKTQREYETVMSQPLPPETEAKARSLLNQVEMERLKRMGSSKAD